MGRDLPVPDDTDCFQLCFFCLEPVMQMGHGLTLLLKGVQEHHQKDITQPIDNLTLSARIFYVIKKMQKASMGYQKGCIEIICQMQFIHSLPHYQHYVVDAGFLPFSRRYSVAFFLHSLSPFLSAISFKLEGKTGEDGGAVPGSKVNSRSPLIRAERSFSSGIFSLKSFPV